MAQRIYHFRGKRKGFMSGQFTGCRISTCLIIRTAKTIVVFDRGGDVVRERAARIEHTHNVAGYVILR